MMLGGVLGLQGGILNLNPESSRVASIIHQHNTESRMESLANTNPESRMIDVVNNHPVAVTAACAVWAKGICVAVKAAKYASSATESKEVRPPGLK